MNYEEHNKALDEMYEKHCKFVDEKLFELFVEVFKENKESTE